MAYYKNVRAPRTEGTAGAELTVTELDRIIANALRAEPGLRDVTVTAEVSGFKVHFASGHWYFSLKDETSVVYCALYQQNQRFAAIRPKDGDRVTVRGYVDFYGQNGNTQLKITELRPAGVGSLYERFEALKRKLDAEGLFHPARKKLLPRFPGKVAVITSASGAALHDILNVSRGRAPGIPIVVVPSGVQGPGAANEIARALKTAEAIPGVDVIILARGGGSVEDLWCFNEESVARAIAACEIPVVSGVGHETDTTIADYVADVRASTPSNAAEIVFPDNKELRGKVSFLRDGLTKTVTEGINRRALTIRETEQRLTRLSPERRIHEIREQAATCRVLLDKVVRESLDKASGDTEMLRVRLSNGVARRTEEATFQAGTLREKLRALSPLNVLDRGYAMVYDENDRLISGKNQAAERERMSIRFSDGTIRVRREAGEA